MTALAFSKALKDVYAQLDSDGNPRNLVRSEMELAAREIEAYLAAAILAGNGVQLESALVDLNSDLNHEAGTLGIVLGDDLNDGYYRKSGASGTGSWVLLKSASFPAEIEIGAVATGEPGSEVIVTNSGTKESAVLNFTIPEGVEGPPGQDGSGVHVLESIAELTAMTKSGLSEDATYYVNAAGVAGNFFWNASSSATVDLLDTFASDEGGSGRFIRSTGTPAKPIQREARPGRDFTLPSGIGCAAALNDVMADMHNSLGGGTIVIPSDTFVLDATVDNIYPHMLIKGEANFGTWGDVFPLMETCRFVAGFGGPMFRHRTPRGDASTRVNMGGGVTGLALHGNNIATSLLEVDSVKGGEYNLSGRDAVGVQAFLFEAGTFGTGTAEDDFGEAPDVQHALIHLRVNQHLDPLVRNTHCVVFNGTETSNVSNNLDVRLDMQHYNGHGLINYTGDNNIFSYIRGHKVGSGTGAVMVNVAGPTERLTARANIYEYVAANTPPLFLGTESGAVASSGTIMNLDKENGTPDVSNGVGARGVVYNIPQPFNSVLTPRNGTLGAALSDFRFTYIAHGRVILCHCSFIVPDSGTAADGFSLTLPMPASLTKPVGPGFGSEFSIQGILFRGYVNTGEQLAYFDPLPGQPAFVDGGNYSFEFSYQIDDS